LSDLDAVTGAEELLNAHRPFTAGYAVEDAPARGECQRD
jgi:hypothetical protein